MQFAAAQYEHIIQQYLFVLYLSYVRSITMVYNVHASW